MATRNSLPPNSMEASGRAALRYPWIRLFLLACLAVLVEGYHFAVDDGEIYIPAIRKVSDPRLYPFGGEFFLSHAHLSLFSPLVGNTARLLHLSVESAVLLWHIGCVFLILVAGWQLAQVFFRNSRAHWCAVALLAGVLPVPVAGTALFLSDNYLTARSFSTPLILFSIGYMLRGYPRLAIFWLVIAALFHPQMAVYCVAFLVLFWWMDRHSKVASPLVGAMPPGATTGSRFAGLLAFAPGLFHTFSFTPAVGVYREVLYSHTYFFAPLWRWYEWIGAIAPLLLFSAVAYLPIRAVSGIMVKTSRTLVVLGVISTAAFLVFSSSSHFDSFTRLQPMRSFHIIYLLMFLMLGGFLGEYALQSRPWRWIALFLPLAVGMFALDHSAYPFSPHIEWPGQVSSNPWLKAFAWARTNTPIDAVFALDPDYMAVPGEDLHGFRAIAGRSALADAYKDNGVVTMFPRLLQHWVDQQQIQHGWRSFGPSDFQRLARSSPATWVIVQHPQQTSLDCPYDNTEVAVCRIGATQ